MKQLFKALANPARVEILKVLSAAQKGQGGHLSNGETSVNVIVEKIPLSPSTISHHLNVLKKAGAVYARKERQWIFYSINREPLEKMREFLSEL
ncbi:MAG: metalloregulator ArsR/SmtB family transcription factor [Candidatus Aquicultor sp.]|nr:metalloregulator ArsR/SmtB family transcription factor [Candidatus Aquicultor sp.]